MTQKVFINLIITFLSFMKLFIISSLPILLLSCNEQIKPQSSKPNINRDKVAIDTTLWLKKTRGIRDILEDRKGNLWFSSPDYIAKFDGKKIHYFSKNDGLNIVGNLHIDINGTVWVENGSDIFHYNGKRFIAKKLERHLAADEIKNGIWVQQSLSLNDTSYVEPGIYNVSSNNSKFIPYPLKKDDDNKYLYYPTTKAYMGKDSTIWTGTMEKVFGLNNSSFITIGREQMGRQNDVRQMGIRGIYVDSKGKLWIADNGAGIFIYDGKEIENFTKTHKLDEGNFKGNSLYRAFSIAEDSLGNMWFGTVYSGVWMYNPKTSEFKNYTQVDGVKSDHIWSIYRTRNGELLFGGESPAAVYKFDGKAFNKIH